jgi:ferric enterobactin receptor
MLKKIYFLIFSCLLIFSTVFSQVSPKKIDVFSDGKTLNEVLNAISISYGYSFKFDEEAFKKIYVSSDLSNKTIEEALNLIISKNALKLKFYKNSDGQFEIIDAKIKINKNAIAKANAAVKNDANVDIDPSKFNFTLTGYVKDLLSGERLPFTTIYIKGKSKISTTTNVDGYFTIYNVPSDTASLYVSYVGYMNKIVKLTPTDNTKDFNITLEASSENLAEIVVNAEKTEVVKANEVVGMIKMTPRNIAKLPNIGERDPFRAFQFMPGVSASNESSAGLYVRGGTPDQTLVMYDGFTVYNVDHLFGFFSAFNYNAIKDIQLYKGGFDARFGGRISAVAEITGKQGNSNKLNAGIDLSLLSSNAYLEAPIGKKLTFLIAARRSYKGPLYTKIFDKFTSNAVSTQPQLQQRPGRQGQNAIQTSQKASSYFYDLNAKLTFQPTKKDILAISTFNGTDNMDNSATNSVQGFGGRGPGGGQAGGGIDLSSTTTDLAKWGNTGASFKWSRKWTEKFYSNSLISYSNYFSDRDNSRTISLTRNGTAETQRLGRIESNNLSDLSAKIDFEYKLKQDHQLEFGAMYTQNSIDFNYTQNDTTTILNRNDKGNVLNIYAQDKIKLFDGKLQIIPGIRLTNFSVTAKNYFEPRFSFNYSIMPKFKLKGALGTYYQFVKQINREDISLGNRNFWILANGTNLPVTKSQHIILGASYELANYLFDVEFYQKQNTGISEYTLRFVPQINQGGGPGGQRGGGGLKVSETFFNGNETIQGVDILVQRKYGDFNGWLGYTLAQASRNIAAFSDKPYYSDQDVRHQFKAVGLYKLKSFDLAATYIFSTGRPYTSILGAYQLTLLDGTTKDFTNPSDKNAQRFINYQRLDLSATYNFRMGSVGASVFNALNRTNVWYKRFEVIREEGVSALQVTDITYLGITPNITLSLKIK